MVVGFSQTPARVELALTPNQLVMRGPYTFTRSPMYVGELGLWLGWAMLYGSITVLLGFVTLGMAVSSLAVPFEERALEERRACVSRIHVKNSEVVLRIP